METAAAISEPLGLPVHAEPLICEYGRLYDDPGLSAAEMRERFPSVRLDSSFPSTGGWAADSDDESKEELVERASGTLEKLCRMRSSGERSVALVTHAHFSGYLVGMTLEIPLARLSANRMRLFNSGVTCIEFFSDYRIVWYANATAHLGEVVTSESSLMWATAGNASA